MRNFLLSTIVEALREGAVAVIMPQERLLTILAAARDPLPSERRGEHHEILRALVKDSFKKEYDSRWETKSTS